MAPAMAIGQAAGTAAALSCTGRAGLQDLDTAVLRNLLREHHAIIGRERYASCHYISEPEKKEF
jgi:hypothetical protein